MLNTMSTKEGYQQILYTQPKQAYISLCLILVLGLKYCHTNLTKPFKSLTQ